MTAVVRLKLCVDVVDRRGFNQTAPNPTLARITPPPRDAPELAYATREHHVRNLLTATIFTVIVYLRNIPLMYAIRLVSVIFLSVFLSDLFVVLQDCQLVSLNSHRKPLQFQVERRNGQTSHSDYFLHRDLY